MEGGALCAQEFSGSPVDGPVHTSAAKQGVVGGVNDGIDLQKKYLELQIEKPAVNQAEALAFNINAKNDPHF